MASNTTPVFPKLPELSSVAITAGNTNSQGAGTIGTDIFLVASTGADGDFVREIRFLPTATTATTTTATVARVFWSTQSSGATTAANTHLLGEVLLPAVGAASASTPVSPVVFPVGYGVPPNATLLVTNHAAPAANTQWKATAIGGSYTA